MRHTTPQLALALAALLCMLVTATAASPAVSAPPDTVCVGIQGSLREHAVNLGPFPGEAFSFVVDIVIPDRQRGSPRCGEGYDVQVRANDPGTLVRDGAMRVGGTAGAVLLDARGDTLYHAPNAIRNVDGTTVYHGRGRRWVILTKRTTPPLRSVSAERYLTAWLEANERMRGDMAAAREAYTAPSTADTEAEIRVWRAGMRRARRTTTACCARTRSRSARCSPACRRPNARRRPARA